MKGTTQTIKVSQFILDYELYPREQIQSYHVNELVHALEAGVVLPPIVVDKKTRRVVDGFHRVRAYQRFYGADAEIPVVLKEYESEAAMYLEAIALNSAHGRPLSTYDKVRCLTRAEELKLEPEVVAKALNITVERITELRAKRIAFYQRKPVALKRTAIHLAGTELEKEQLEFNIRAGGMNQTFYINQVIAMLESDTVDWDDEKTVRALKRLYDLLDKALKPIEV